MALKVIGAGLGRTATFSLKFALEHVGLGPCYHMSEVFAGARRNVPLWLDVVRGKPDWDAVFEGFASTTDYPACTYWRELAAFYPNAKVILTVRDADSWFDSVTETIFSPQ
ncbi:MAG TPA: sulfotransferase, partial [Gammaproteobacteria bacterium]